MRSVSEELSHSIGVAASEYTVDDEGSSIICTGRFFAQMLFSFAEVFPLADVLTSLVCTWHWIPTFS